MTNEFNYIKCKKELMVSDLIAFLENHSVSGATEKPREICFWLCDKDGRIIKELELFTFSTGDGLITNLGLHFREKEEQNG